MRSYTYATTQKTDAKQQQFLTKTTATDEAALQPAAFVLEYLEQNKRGAKGVFHFNL